MKAESALVTRLYYVQNVQGGPRELVTHLRGEHRRRESGRAHPVRIARLRRASSFKAENDTATLYNDPRHVKYNRSI